MNPPFPNSFSKERFIKFKFRFNCIHSKALQLNELNLNYAIDHNYTNVIETRVFTNRVIKIQNPGQPQN